MRNYKKYSVLILAVAVLVICALAIQKVQAEVIFQELVPWTQVITNNSCLPEETVMLIGQLSILETVTIDGDGKEHWTLHKRPVDVQLFSAEWVPDPTDENPDNGYYQPVGDPWPYLAVGITQYSNSVDYEPLNVVEVAQNNFWLIGRGNLPDYRVQMNYSLKVELDEEGNYVFDYKVYNVNITCN
jgi:hypothetical protein